MRIHYNVIDVEDINSEVTNNHNRRNEEQNEIAVRGGPRAVAMRIQKQIIQHWFPNYIDGDA